MIGKQITKLVKENLPDCIYWSYLESNLLPGQINLNSFASDPNICEPLKHMFALAGYSDIAQTIATAKQQTNGIRNLLNRVAKIATKHMKSVWKDYRAISIALEPNGSSLVDAYIKDEHNVFDFAKRSDGFKRFITFLLMISTKVKTEKLINALYLHDEPYVSLHPSGARYLRDELIKISQKNYVVFSTHSIFMIDRELIGRHLIVKKDSEITTTARADHSNIIDEEVIYNALGYTIFENLKKNNIIFEGWRDKRLFQVAIKNKRDLNTAYSEFGTCHAKGVKDIGRITPLLELADRHWLIISDADRAAKEQKKHYTGNGIWYCYDELMQETPALTAEDFIKPETFVSALKLIKSEIASLADLEISTLSGPEPKIKILRDWLKNGGLSEEEIKDRLEFIKENVFNNLKSTNIEDKYFNMLRELAREIKN